jgi:hypothetical protein
LMYLDCKRHFRIHTELRRKHGTVFF